MSNTLGKKERLKHRKRIDELFNRGKSFFVQPYRLYYSVADAVENEPPLQFGVGVSKRYFKKAADRNRIKRLTREAYRLQCNPLKTLLRQKGGRLDVFFIYTAKELPSFDQCAEAVAYGLNKLCGKLKPGT